MTISVDIADRLYDYTDEEVAAIAVADFQREHGLDDGAVLFIWATSNDPRRTVLEAAIFDAVDSNGTAKRAKEAVPGHIELFIAS